MIVPVGRALLRLALIFGISRSAAADTVDFRRDVLPILSDKCFHCHGPDEGRRKAGLRLDLRESAIEAAIIPGQPDDSDLVERIESSDKLLGMPPQNSGLSLNEREKRILREWIREGATYENHWAFDPLPAQVELPLIHRADWPGQPIDCFVLARLEAEQVLPSGRASPLRWLRRAMLDLTGLPPSLAEIAQFERDWSHDRDLARARVVDRLLALPAYGEHMAVAWLDAARYADSFGFQADQLNTQWPYRDWVVRALNANVPYDQFLTWQLAGDLLERPIPDQILATAFNRLHRMTNEGGSIFEEWLVENTADRVHTFGTVFLGLTLECARCHDHKYDPIGARDYYSLFAFFNSIDENGLYDDYRKVPSPSLLLPTPEQQQALAEAQAALAAGEAEIRTARLAGEQRFQTWWQTNAVETLPIDPSDLVGYFTFDDSPDETKNQAPGTTNAGKGVGLKSVAGVRGRAIEFAGDHGMVFADFFRQDRWDEFSIDVWLRDLRRNPGSVVVLQQTFGSDVGYNGYDVLLQDGLLSVRLYRVWPGNGFGVRTTAPLSSADWQRLTITYDGSSQAAGIRIYVDGSAAHTEILRDHVVKRVGIKIRGDGNLILGARFRDRSFEGGQLDELRLYTRALTEWEVSRLGNAVDSQTAPSELDGPSHRDALCDYYFSAIDASMRQLRETLRDRRRDVVLAEEAIHEVSVMHDLPRPRPAHLLARGAYDAPRTEQNRVERDTFRDILPSFPENEPRNRLGLARWLTAPDHPLTARVFVNRVWANFFGRGLVTTPENFGRQGAYPAHRQLLDWLSRDFIDHGWDIKRLCRQIVLSSTYGQDSTVPLEMRARDPDNDLLARGPAHRLSAEQIRDLALAASGLLDRASGGPPVSPYQPGDDLWREANTMSPAYRQSTGRALYRRSIYSVRKRTAPLPNVGAFDAPSREVCLVARSRTNTPLQALVLLNDIQFVEAARRLAEELLENECGDAARITAAFRRASGRPPDAVELRALLELLRHQRSLFSAASAVPSALDARSFIAIGDTPADSAIDPVELAALTVVCQTVLNLDAAVWKR